MPANTTAFSRLLAPGLRKVFYDNWKQHPEEYSQIANVEESKRAYEEEMTMAGLGRFQQKEELKSLIYDEPKEGSVKRYTHTTFSLGFQVSREMYDDDLYGVMKKMSRELARSARQTVELEFGALLDDVFSGSLYTGADDEALCSQTHSLVSGGSYANMGSAASDLGIGALRAASERMERTPNERGLPEARGRGKLLVVSPTYQWIAKELIGSEKQPYTGDNTLNAFDGMGLSYLVNHYMSEDDHWLLLAGKSDHDIKFFWRIKPQFENTDDFDTKTAKFSGYMRFSLGFTDWRGVDGGSGTAADYS